MLSKKERANKYVLLIMLILMNICNVRAAANWNVDNEFVISSWSIPAVLYVCNLINTADANKLVVNDYSMQIT